MQLKETYNISQKDACFKATEGLQPLYRTAPNGQHSVANFARLRVLRCLHSLALRCLCCNII